MLRKSQNCPLTAHATGIEWAALLPLLGFNHNLFLSLYNKDQGSSSCKPRPPCTDQDYFYTHTACDASGEVCAGQSVFLSQGCLRSHPFLFSTAVTPCSSVHVQSAGRRSLLKGHGLLESCSWLQTFPCLCSAQPCKSLEWAESAPCVCFGRLAALCLGLV